MADITNIGFRVDTSQIEKGYSRFNKMGSAAEVAEKKTSSALGSIGKSAGQAGIQIQQFVGQVQMGTSPLVAMSQQAADLGIVLGAPLLGAITGIAASIGTVFLPALFDAEDATDKLKETLEAIDKVAVQTAGGTFTLTEEIARLAKVSETAANAQIALSITEATQAINLARDSASDAVSELDNLFNGFDVVSTPEMIDKLNSAMERTGLSASELIETTNLYTTGLTQVRSFSESLNSSLGTTTEQSIQLVRAVSDFKSGGSVSDLAKTFSEISLNTSGATKEFQSLAVQLNSLSLTTEKSESVLTLLKEVMGDLDGILNNSESAVNDIIDSFKMKTEALHADEVQMAKNIAMQAAGADVTDTEREKIESAIDAYYRKINAIRAEEKAQREARIEREKAAREAEREAEAIQRAIEKQAQAYSRWIASVQDAVDPTIKLREEIDDLWLAMLAGDMDEGVATARINQIQEQIDSFKSGMDELNINPFESMTSGAQDALSAMSGMFESGSKDAQKLAIAMQALNLVQAVGAVLNQGKGDPYTAFGRMAAMAAMVESLGVSIGNLGGDFQDESQQNQASQGLNVWGEKSESILEATEITAGATEKLVGINTNMLKAMQGLTVALSSAAGMIVRDTAIPTASVSVRENLFEGLQDFFSGDVLNLTGLLGETFTNLLNLPLNIIGNWLGGSSSVTDEGIRILGGTFNELMDDVTVQAFQSVKYKKWKYGSTKNKTVFQDAGDEVGQQFALVFESIANSVAVGAEALGLSASEIEKRINEFEVATTTISLRGLSAEDQKKEIEAVFSQIFSDLAGDVVPFAKDFQQVGEDLGTTLARLASQVAVAEEITARFGINFGDKFADPEAYASAADNLATLVGGVEELAEKTSSFTNTFATDAQLFDIYQRAMNEALNEVGLTLPSTSEGLYDLMMSLDGTTEAGREQIATLLGLTDTASEYFKLLDKTAGAYRKAAEGLFDITEASRAMSLESALAAARLGDFSLAEQLDLGSIAPSTSDFNTALEYNLARAETAARLNELADLQSGQISVEDKQLTVLEEIRDKLGDSDTMNDEVKKELMELRVQMSKQQTESNDYLRRLAYQGAE